MTADIIQARYDELDTLATRFGQQAELTATLDAQVRRGLQALEHGGWEGKGSAAFVAEMYGTLLPANDRLRQALDDARAVTLEAKQIYQHAEQEAAAIFGKGPAGTSGVGAGGHFSGGEGTSLGGEKGAANGHEESSSFFKALASAGEFVLHKFEPQIEALTETAIAGLKNGSVKDWLEATHLSGIANHLPIWAAGTALTFFTEEPSGRGHLHDLVKAGITTGITMLPWVRVPMLINDGVQLGGHVLGMAGFKDTEHFIEQFDMHKPIEWAVEQEMERWEDGGVNGLMRRQVAMLAGPVGMSAIILDDAVQIVGGKLLHIHGIENLDFLN